jgi:hypothetical protein
MEDMRSLPAALLGALAAAGAFALASLASGGPPPESDAPPAVRTVVAHGSGEAKVVRPARLNNRTIERAARRARAVAVPKAVKAARREAANLARAADLRPSGPIGIAQDVSPYGYYNTEAGRFGPGDWCGRWVRRRRDGTRVARHRCFPPHEQAVQVTVTFATG